MPENSYAYAVARIRAKELALLNTQSVEALLAAKSAEDCMRLLEEKSWPADNAKTPERLLSAERERTWGLLAELTDDLSVFDVFLYNNDFHNLKAATKLAYTDQEPHGVFLSNGTVEPQVLFEAVKSRSYADLPERLRGVAEEAYLALSHTGDSQLCDMIIDRAALAAILEAGRASKSELIKKYAELTAATADIKIAVRCQKTGKSLEFITRGLAPCESIEVVSLAAAAATSQEALLSYLDSTAYAGAAQALRVSMQQFERWCDNVIIELIRPQKYNPFSVDPLAAYLLAKENELKIVRIILSAKVNGLSAESVRERLRELYV